MTKRRNDDEGFANVLRQKPKEDLDLKQKIAQNTFAMLMKAQRNIQHTMDTEPSYQYFNTSNDTPSNSIVCHRCQAKTETAEKCNFCENMTCSDCLQSCVSCQSLYCSVCCILDYSLSITQAFCLSCKQTL